MQEAEEEEAEENEEVEEQLNEKKEEKEEEERKRVEWIADPACRTFCRLQERFKILEGTEPRGGHLGEATAPKRKVVGCGAEGRAAIAVAERSRRRGPGPGGGCTLQEWVRRKEGASRVERGLSDDSRRTKKEGRKALVPR